MQTHGTETVDAPRLVVTITTTDTTVLVPALLAAGASVMVQPGTLSVRGLTAAEVADIAAAQLALVTDLAANPAGW